MHAIRSRLPADGCRGVIRRQHRGDQRGLPLPQRVDAGPGARRRAAGDGVDPRGRLHHGAALPIYNGENLAASGVVVVTINYRLGPLGFWPTLRCRKRTRKGPPATTGCSIRSRRFAGCSETSLGSVEMPGGLPFSESRRGISVCDL